MTAAPGLLAPAVEGSPFPPGGRIGVVRLDGAGDIILAEPVVRAVAARADEVVVLCGPAGAGAAAALGHPTSVVDPPWVALDPPPASRRRLEQVVEQWRRIRLDGAVILTSYHQSALPAAALLRLVGVDRLAGCSADHAGALLDVRLRSVTGHQTKRNAAVAAAAGYPVADLVPRLRPPAPPPWLAPLAARRPVVVHVGASVAARGLPEVLVRTLVADLTDQGRTVALTGSVAETAPHRALVDGVGVVDLGGRTDFHELAALVGSAAGAVCGNTAVAHLAAAVETPLVCVFAPTVDPATWAPTGPGVVVLGDRTVGCRGCRARTCPVPGQPCTASVTPTAVAHGLDVAAARLGASTLEEAPCGS